MSPSTAVILQADASLLCVCPEQAGREPVKIKKLCDFVSMVPEIISFASQMGFLGWPPYYTNTNKQLAVACEFKRTKLVFAHSLQGKKKKK